jgi:23S rRNA pseudouridine1911/1915/1917 synthase
MLPGARIDREITLAAPARLDEALGLPRRTLGALCAAGRVRVLLPGERFGRAVLVGRPHLAAGARVVVLAAEADPRFLPEELPLVLLHDDLYLLAVDKPAGMVVTPGLRHPAGTLANALRALPGSLSAREGPFRPGIVHRLDAGTSGVLVVARTDAAHDALVAQFHDHRALRRYLALVRGAPAWDTFTIEAPLARRRVGRRAFAPARDGQGRAAATDLRVLARGAEVALVEARPRTGRTHQIRVHLAALGHPLVGDTLYGGPASRRAAEALGLARPGLHAERLTLAHPADGRALTLVAPLPADLTAACARAGVLP